MRDVELQLPSVPMAENWNLETLKALRSAVYRRDRGDVADLIRGHPVGDVLQTIGDVAVIAVEDGAPGWPELAAQCIAALRDRGWAGDVDLADQLDAASAATPPALRSLPVELEELCSILEGDLMNSGGMIDLRTGQTWPDVVLEDSGEEVFDEDELEDSTRWLHVESIGSRDGYRDMVDFAGTITDPRLAGQLDVALDGRGAFRRFKNVLSEAPEEFTRFMLFSDERKLGRAREWLAAAGYRVRLESRRP
ncbi:hypothetical protein VZC37_07730 [Gordonia sp. LSe1-13]|uniref:Uncharacterized protein n=1 Tax=Gordonia sesuvii TaxID=3116777 RepID=A0ABU7MAZ4_9ACTN|nr:hypothetical protein [Gordonia sp. LSe1-13]